MLSPDEAQRRQDEDTLEEMTLRIQELLAGHPTAQHERMLRNAGLWEVWSSTAQYPPWKRCRHGGPYMSPETMKAGSDLIYHFAFSGSQPTLEHVKLVGCEHMQHLQETMACGGAKSPALVFASMAADAYINKDVPNTKKFMMVAFILDAISSSGDARAFFTELSEKKGPVVMKLEGRLQKANESCSSLRSSIEQFVTCDCLERAARQKASMNDCDFARHKKMLDKLRAGIFQFAGHAGCTVTDVFSDKSVLISMPGNGVTKVPMSVLAGVQGFQECSTCGGKVEEDESNEDDEVSNSGCEDCAWDEASSGVSMSSGDDDAHSDCSNGYSFAGIPFNCAVSTNPMQFMNEMEALDLKNTAVALQESGDYEKALPLMLRSVKLRENSHTICLSLSELADLYLDMLKLDKAEAACMRMLQEASTPYRYDNANQIRIANEVLADVQKEKQYGIRYGLKVVVEGLKNQPDLNGKEGIVRGRRKDSCGRGRIMVEVDSKRLLLHRVNFRPQEKPRKTLVSFDQVRFAFWESVKRTCASESVSATSINSNASLLSAAGSHPKCFLAGTMFRCPSGALARIEDVQVSEILTGSGGRNVMVTEVILHPLENRKLVFLHTAAAAIIVTTDHRVVVPRGDQQQTIPAGHLAVGDTISCGDGEHKLIEAKHVTANVSVYQLTFTPDIPIETFYDRLDTGTAILTKGTKQKPVFTRRGGMKKKKTLRPAYPPTEDSWY